MPTTHPLTIAVRDADRSYYRFDKHRDRESLRRTVIELAAGGLSTSEIAPHVKLLPKQISHIISGRFNPDHKPEPVAPRDYSHTHCTALERTADHALDLACRLRDEDPQIIWDALTGLGRRDLQELAVVLLAALPIDKSKADIFAWVYQIGGDE